ncbi:hypothetical protein SPSIL_017260 [Sporomusa silvacetica DSM 10669]|uniref:Uncharacterized protein n=1 Tax=Sporomusa silvacetica DSM 10669 TaxID=1123289 RepID=A0ABZ3IIU6_9FIRM|nr:hypothetical protein SPSIL_25790 [Sporomusa silvacetica DSM 10669]
MIIFWPGTKCGTDNNIKTKLKNRKRDWDLMSDESLRLYLSRNTVCGLLVRPGKMKLYKHLTYA